MVIINVDDNSNLTWEQKLADPMVMLHSKLDEIKRHLEVEDDYLPAVRVDLGTGQVASAFGCEIVYPENNLPAAGSHPLKSIDDVYKLSKPSVRTGLLEQTFEWMEIWKQVVPDWIEVQLPDIQGPFNNAHLIRGNDILLDFYDDPQAVGYLLDLVVDFTVDLLREIHSMIGYKKGWFCDWGGAYWKGGGRISNCSVDMISPEFYKNYVMPRDIRLLDSIGKGRMHYCGGNGDVIDEFLRNPVVTGIDVDASLHDLWDVADKAPKETVLVFQSYGKEFEQIDRLLRGDWPEKRNIILITNAPTVEQGRDILARLRESIT
jgi:hypothetical protein